MHQKPTLGFPDAVMLQAKRTHRNLFLGILVQLPSRLYKHKVTYSQASWLCCRLNMITGTSTWVSCCSSTAHYANTKVPSLRYIPSSNLVQIHCRLYKQTHRNLILGILHTGRYLFSVILVQLCCRLSMHTGT